MSSLRFSQAVNDDLFLFDASARVVVLGPVQPDMLVHFDKKAVQIVQTSFQMTTRLTDLGFDVVPSATGVFDLALVGVPRSKAQAFDLIAQARALAPDGVVLVDGQKTDGIESILKAVKAKVPSVDVFSKAHGKLIWFAGKDGAGLLDWTDVPRKIDDTFTTTAGVFSADGIDVASAMLAAHFSQKLGPKVADLGAGWGYLSARLLDRAPDAHVTLVEDDANALLCARENLNAENVEFIWADVLGWTSREKFDAVVMNPPFHQGRSAVPELGQGFIRSAARNLKPRGTLLMVANSGLPYEPVLESCFSQVTLIEKAKGFKVIEAANPRRKTK